MIKASHNHFKWLALILLAWSIIMTIAMFVDAATEVSVTVPDPYTEYLTVTYSNNYNNSNASASFDDAGTKITFSATGYKTSGTCPKDETSTTTLTVKAKKDIKITFSTTSTTATIGGSAVSSPVDLKEGGSLTLQVTSPAGSGSTPASIEIKDISEIVSSAPEDCAAYYILGTPATTYDYLDEAITAAGTSGTIVVTKSGTVYHSDGETKSFTIPAGVTLLLPYSASDTTVQGVISSNNSYLAHANYAYAVTDGQQTPQKNVTYTLTIPKDVIVAVADGSAATVGKCGRIVVGGQFAFGNGTTTFVGATYKDHSNLVVDGKLDLGNYAILSATGYVLGDGQIIAEGTGAQIYQPMIIMDFPGAAVAALAMREGISGTAITYSGEEKYSPYIYWGVVNIQTDLQLSSGNLMYAHCVLGDDSKPYYSNAVLVGDNSTAGLLILDSNAILYNHFQPITWSGYSYGFLGQNQIRIEGGASMGSLQLTLNAGGLSESIDTASVTVGIGYNFDITLAGNSNGTSNYYINHSMMLLPGARLTVDEDATLTIGNTASVRFAVWDGLIHRGYRQTIGYSKAEYIVESATTCNKKVNYPTNVELDKGGLSEDADFFIDGKLVIGAKASIGGIIQTNGGGTVDASGTTTSNLSVMVQSNALDYQKVNYQWRAMASMSLFGTMTDGNVAGVSAKLNLNGRLTAIQPGVTYVGTANTAMKNTGFVNIYYPGFDANGTPVASENLSITYSSAETINGIWLCAAHSWNGDCKCDVCSILTFYATNINMGDNLDLLFAIPVSAFGNAGGQDYYVVFQRGDNTTEPLYIENWEKRGITNNNQSDLEGTDYYVLTYGDFAAKEMCEEVTVLIYGKQEDGSYAIVSVSLTTSIRKYALSILKNSSNAALKKTVTDMLNYGAACQQYFDPSVSADQLANYNIDQGCASNTVYRTEDSVPVNPDSSASTRWYATQIVAESSIRLRIAFDTNVTEGMYFSYAFKGHKGNALKHEDTKHKFTSTDVVSIDSTTYACGIIDTLVTADAGLKYEQEDGSFEYFEIEIKVYDSNGNELETFTECIMDYVIRNAGTDGTDVYTMLMRFSESALAYQTEKRG